MTPAAAAGLWAPSGPYLDTATYGLPPTAGLEAIEAALAGWRSGTARWEDWNEQAGRARRAFARLIDVPSERVAVGASVSELVGLIAASLPRGRVVSAEGEFASALWPWVAQRFDVVTVPLDRVADAVDGSTSVVVVSAVQSSTGALAELDAIAAAASEHGALTVVDATHACGWLPLEAARFDGIACAGYKWLCSPRGTAYLALSEELAERLTPVHAGWYAGEDPYSSYYGLPMRLAESARRFDTSPAWFSWVGAAPAVEAFAAVGVEAVHEHDVRLANRFRAGLGLPPGRSAIVTVEAQDAAERLERAGVRAATRAGSVRASFHLYTTEAHVDAALDALTG